jgi:hypothetical protein
MVKRPSSNSGSIKFSVKIAPSTPKFEPLTQSDQIEP